MSSKQIGSEVKRNTIEKIDKKQTNAMEIQQIVNTH